MEERKTTHEAHFNHNSIVSWTFLISLKLLTLFSFFSSVFEKNNTSKKAKTKRKLRVGLDLYICFDSRNYTNLEKIKQNGANSLRMECRPCNNFVNEFKSYKNLARKKQA